MNIMQIFLSYYISAKYVTYMWFLFLIGFLSLSFLLTKKKRIKNILCTDCKLLQQSNGDLRFLFKNVVEAYIFIAFKWF